MTFVVASTITLISVLIIGKIAGPRLKGSRLVRDMDLSVSSLITALSVTTLIAYAVAIGAMATNLVDNVSAMDQATYEQTVASTPVQAEAQMSEPSTEAGSETKAAAEPDNQVQSSTSAESAAVPAKASAAAAMVQDPAGNTISAQAPAAVASTLAPAVPAAEFADGTYSGTGYGFRGNITVDVSVRSGKITDVVVTDQQDDRRWFERAYSGVVQRILSAQSENVDTVSGATYSSRGILDGVAEALNKARSAVKQVTQ